MPTGLHMAPDYIGAILHGNFRYTVPEGGSDFLQSFPKR